MAIAHHGVQYGHNRPALPSYDQRKRDHLLDCLADGMTPKQADQEWDKFMRAQYAPVPAPPTKRHPIIEAKIKALREKQAREAQENV